MRDSNPRRPKPAGLQPAPFDHSGNLLLKQSCLSESNRQPHDYKSSALPVELRQRIKKWRGQELNLSLRFFRPSCNHHLHQLSVFTQTIDNLLTDINSVFLVFLLKTVYSPVSSHLPKSHYQWQRYLHLVIFKLLTCYFFSEHLKKSKTI